MKLDYLNITAEKYKIATQRIHLYLYNK